MRAPNGDLVFSQPTGESVSFRQVGWIIRGGAHDGEMVTNTAGEVDRILSDGPHGGFAPLYVEIGD